MTHQVNLLKDGEQLMILNNGEIVANDSYENILAKPNDSLVKLLVSRNENEQRLFRNEDLNEKNESYSIDFKEKREHKWFESTNSITTTSSRMFVVRNYLIYCSSNFQNLHEHEYFARTNKTTLKSHIEVDL